jgi:transcriptional regulator with XRE-family HTH domain
MEPNASAPWSVRKAAITVLFVPGTDRDRLAYKKRLGRSIEQLRRRLGFTQESFAEALGVDNNTVGRWESGKTEPRAYDLARVLGRLRKETENEIPAEWLIDPTDSITETEARLATLQRRAETAESKRWGARGARRVRASASGPVDELGRRSA